METVFGHSPADHQFLNGAPIGIPVGFLVSRYLGSCLGRCSGVLVSVLVISGNNFQTVLQTARIVRCASIGAQVGVLGSVSQTVTLHLVHGLYSFAHNEV